MSGQSLITEAVGRKITAMLLRQAAELNALLVELQSDLSGDEFKATKAVVGAVMLEIYKEGLDPLFKILPHLKPDGLK
jgi:hypothetical protein